MKSIQISQIKADDFNVVDVIEKNIIIRKKDIKSTHEDIKELIRDVEGLKEALFFKHEKIKMQYRTLNNSLDTESMQEFVEKIDKLNINSLAESKDVLQRNKEIYELKLINKVIRYAIEVEKKNYNVLTGLLKSEEKSDWRFLCFFINKTINIFEEEIKHKILEITKEIQEKLVNVFEDGKKFKNKTMMKSAYIALSELDNSNTLLQTYIYDVEIFKKVYKMVHPQVDTIDIELYDEETNTFLDFLNEIKSSYQDNFTNISEIFPDYNEAYAVVNSKLYYDLIFPVLDEYLKNTSSFVFLYSLETAYKNINNLGIFIESICMAFDNKSILNEIKERYGALAIDKERSFFEEILNKLIYGTSTNYKYIIFNDSISFCKDYMKVIKILLELINMFFERSDMFYGKTDIEDMHVFYSDCLVKVLEAIFDEENDKLNCIVQLQRVYSQTRKYFKEDFYKLESFSIRYSSLLESALKWKTEQIEGRLKQIIDQIYFYKIERDSFLISYLKDQIHNSKVIEGKTQGRYVERIMEKNLEKLKNRIFEVKFSEVQKKTLKCLVENIMNIVYLIGNPKITNQYKNLENIVHLITVEGDVFKDILNLVKIRINEKDLKKAIRSRNESKPIL